MMMGIIIQCSIPTHAQFSAIAHAWVVLNLHEFIKTFLKKLPFSSYGTTYGIYAEEAITFFE